MKLFRKLTALALVLLLVLTCFPSQSLTVSAASVSGTDIAAQVSEQDEQEKTEGAENQEGQTSPVTDPDDETTVDQQTDEDAQNVQDNEDTNNNPADDEDTDSPLAGEESQDNGDEKTNNSDKPANNVSSTDSTESKADDTTVSSSDTDNTAAGNAPTGNTPGTADKNVTASDIEDNSNDQSSTDMGSDEPVKTPGVSSPSFIGTGTNNFFADKNSNYVINENDNASSTDMPVTSYALILLADDDNDRERAVNNSTQVDWKQFNGYNSNGTMNSSVGSAAGKCTVYIGTTQWASGTYRTVNTIAASGITIKPAFGYYVKQVVIACNDNGGYNCNTAKNDGIAKFGNSSTTSADYTIPASKLGLNATVNNRPVWHNGAGTPLHIMIWLEKSPNPLTVTYDAGEAGGKDVAISDIVTYSASAETQPSGVVMESGYPSESNDVISYKYADGTTTSPEHTILDAKVKTYNDGTNSYQFTGWKVYVKVDNAGTDSWNAVSGSSSVGDKLKLYTDFKLVAQWEVVTSYSVTSSAVSGTTSIGDETGYAASDSVDNITPGEDVKVYFKPVTGYVLSSVVIDGTEHKDGSAAFEAVEAGCYTFEDISANHTIKAVYTARSDLEYTVNYYLYDTDIKIQDSVTVENQTFGSKVTVSVPEIDGYTAVSSDEEITIVPTGNVVNFYYKKNITITADDVTETYDGTVYGGETATASDGLYGSDTLDSYSVVGSAVLVGEYVDQLEVEDVVITRDGTDVTYQYEITLVPGTLTIKPRNLTVTLTSDVFEYDGTEKELEDAEYEGLADGDEIEIKVEHDTCIEVDVYDWTISNVTVTREIDGKTVDVTECYNIETTDATLEITIRALTITAGSAEKTYDGEALTEDSWELTEGTLAEGHEISSVTVTGSIVMVDSIANVASDAVILDAEGNDVSDQYDITYIDGTLTVGPRDLTVTLTSDVFDYDGTEKELEDAEYEGLADGDEIQIEVEHDTCIDVDVYDWVISNVTITREIDGKTVDVTECYNIETTDATLEIIARELTITAGSAEKTYDGQELTEDSWELTEGTLAEGHEISSVTVTGSLVIAGSIANVASDAVILDDAGNDVTEQYEITYVDGELVINKCTLLVYIESETIVYDGADHQIDTAEYEGLVEGDEINIQIDSEVGRDVGLYDAIITDVTVTRTVAAPLTRAASLDNNTIDVTDCYDITTQDGTLEITVRQITITAGSASKTYDGKALTENSWTLTSGTLADNQTIDSVTVTGSITLPGKAANTASDAVIIDVQGVDVTSNYEITYADGTLTVKGEVPKTGDNDTSGLQALMVLCGLVMFAIIIENKRKNALAER